MRLNLRCCNFQGLGVTLKTRTRWEGFDGTPTVLAMGGASWPHLGSDAAWVPILRAAGIRVNGFKPANSRFMVNWTPLFRDRFAGTPVKNVGLTYANNKVRGELMISQEGIEGGAIYALSRFMREAPGEPLQIDLRPDMTITALAEKLNKYGIKIIGTEFKSLDLAEDRGRFSTLLRDLNIPYPKFGVVENAGQSVELSRDLGFPLLVRPSYVLGGQGMKIVINEDELETHVIKILQDIPDNKILLDHFLEKAIEAEADAICDGEDVYVIGIMEHIEPAGIHSGRIAQPLREHPAVKNFRNSGMIWAFEVDSPHADFAQRCFHLALEQEILLRPMGRTVYFMPPYVISEAEMDKLITGSLSVIEALN